MTIENDPAPGETRFPLVLAPCGCTGRGRFISKRGCTQGHVTNRQTVTALKRGRVIIPAGMTGVREDAAYQLGRQAYANGTMRIPAIDAGLRELLDGLPVGQGLPVLRAWDRGFDQAATEAANATLTR